MGCVQSTELPDPLSSSDLILNYSTLSEPTAHFSEETHSYNSFEAVDLHTTRTSDSSNSLGYKTSQPTPIISTLTNNHSTLPTANIPLNNHQDDGDGDGVLFLKVRDPLPDSSNMVHFQRPANADHHGTISNPLVMPPTSTITTHGAGGGGSGAGSGAGAGPTSNRLDSERIAAIQERLLRSANSAHSLSSGGNGNGGGGASSCPQTRISSSSFSGHSNAGGNAPPPRGSSSGSGNGGGPSSNGTTATEVTKSNSSNGLGLGGGGSSHQRSVLVPTPPWALTRRGGGANNGGGPASNKGPPQLRRVYQSSNRSSGSGGLGNTGSQENLLEPNPIGVAGGAIAPPTSDIPIVETLSPHHPGSGSGRPSEQSQPSAGATFAASGPRGGKPALVISPSGTNRHPSMVNSTSLNHTSHSLLIPPPTSTPPPTIGATTTATSGSAAVTTTPAPAPIKKVRPLEEDFLSDISSSDTPSLPSSSRNSPSSANRRSSARGHKGDEIEQERNRMPLNIEEDLFVYDDIVISKDEARTKHWRLAGRKSGLDGNSRRGSISMNQSSSAGSNTTNFSFNDFDVCVDEMDVAPSSSSSAAAVKVLLSSLDNQEATPGSSQVLSADMSVTWTQPRRQQHSSGLGASNVSGGSRQSTAAANGGLPRKLTDRPIKNFTCKTLRGHATRVKCISLSPSEKEFVSCSNEDASVMLNSFTVGDEVGIFTSHQETVICTAFSPDGKLLATSSKDRSMKLWDVMTTKLLLTYNHSKVVICCCFSPDSRYVVSGCQDRVCRLWDTRRGKEWLAYSQHEGIIISVAFSPDSNYICSASADSTLRVWTSTTAKTKFTLTGHQGIILSCSYTSDGAYIISNDESQVRVWSTEDGSCQLSLSPEMLLGSPTFSTPYGDQRVGWTLSAAAPGAFTNYILVACNNRFVYVIDRRTGEEVLSTFCKAPVYCLSSGWNELVACGDSFGNIYVLRLM